MRLLKHTLLYTGEKEIQIVQGKENEILSSQRLNVDEASQRRHFLKIADPIEEETDKKLRELAEEHNKKVETKKAEVKKALPVIKDETDEQKNKRVDKLIKGDTKLTDSIKNVQEDSIKIATEIHELKITDKTKKVCNKYFEEFGEKNGFTPADDESLEELTNALK